MEFQANTNTASAPLTKGMIFNCDKGGPNVKPPAGWDYMFAFENSSAKQEHRAALLTKLVQADFQISQILTEDKYYYLVRFSLPESILKRNAEAFEFKLQLMPEFGGGYLHYSDERDHCFRNFRYSTEYGSPYFSSAERIELILMTLGSGKSFGANIDIQRELLDGRMAHALAIHDLHEREELVNASVYEQLWNPLWQPPFNRMRHYFGSRVGLYFVFVSFMSVMLAIASAVGVPLYVIYLLKLSEVSSAAVRTSYGLLLSIWVTLFAEFWKRRNAGINLAWGTLDLDDDTADHIRPQYQGEIKTGFYASGGFISLQSLADQGDGEDSAHELPRNVHSPAVRGRLVMCISFAVTAVFCGLAVGVTVLLLLFRGLIISKIDSPWALVIPGILNGLLITVLDGTWRGLSMKLTMKENHRSNQSFNDSLVYKRFGFQVCSNYTSLFFIAFVKPFIQDSEPCRPGWASISGESDCLGELEIQMVMLLLTRITVSQVVEVCGPLISSWVKTILVRYQVKQVAQVSSMSRYYKETALPEYQMTIDDFGEVVLLLGYVAFFGAAFPLAPFLVLVNNLVEVRTDAYKILMGHRRIDADHANHIGAWHVILEFIGFASVLINAGLIVFTSNTFEILFPGVTMRQKILAFFVIENGLVLAKLTLASLIPDVPARVLKQKNLQDFYIARYFKVGERSAYRGQAATCEGDANALVRREVERSINVVDTASDSEYARGEHNEAVLLDVDGEAFFDSVAQ